MTVIDADSATELFARTARNVLRDGERVQSHGLATVEIFGAMVAIAGQGAVRSLREARSLSP